MVQTTVSTWMMCKTNCDKDVKVNNIKKLILLFRSKAVDVPSAADVCVVMQDAIADDRIKENGEEKYQKQANS